MKFFEDFNIPKNATIGITGLISNITTRQDSHKGGWSRLLKCQLENLNYSVKILTNEDYLNSFDVIIFDLGAEYSGAINMFGGLDTKVYQRLQELKEYKGQLFSWRNKLPDLTKLQSRRNNKSTCEGFKNEPDEFLSWVQIQLNSTKVFDHAYRTNSLLIGDSHTPGVWTPEYMIARRDGRTLAGFLEFDTVGKYVRNFKENGVDIYNLTVHCSSIDIRHHLQREAQPPQKCADMAGSLVDQISKFRFTNVTLVHSMGIEDESRELPKTGYFKGTPFCGSWEERNLLRKIFNAMIEECGNDYGWNILPYPTYFFDETGKLRFGVMEKPQSIHISPEHYRWDLDLNKDRWIHEEGR